MNGIASYAHVYAESINSNMCCFSPSVTRINDIPAHRKTATEPPGFEIKLAKIGRKKCEFASAMLHVQHVSDRDLEMTAEIVTYAEYCRVDVPAAVK